MSVGGAYSDLVKIHGDVAGEDADAPKPMCALDRTKSLQNMTNCEDKAEVEDNLIEKQTYTVSWLRILRLNKAATLFLVTGILGCIIVGASSPGLSGI